jgi:alpha-glucosidase
MSKTNQYTQGLKGWPLKPIIYQIYPRSFKDSNNDGVGDLPGIIEKLDYLKDLGVDAIWLSPIYKSPMVDMGYDISDYKDIDSIFGNLADFDNLISESHKRNIRVLMDFVPNHTSSLHPWFLESKKSLKSSKRDFYIWKKGKKSAPPNNWLSVFGGSAWELDKTTNEYYYHSFDRQQPDLNWRNPEVIQEMQNVLRFWLDKGVDGFRVDVPEWTYKDERFLDEPANPLFNAGMEDPYHSLQHIYTCALPESSLLIKQFADVLEEYQNKFMVTEAWSPVERLIENYNIVGKDFYAPFNFGLITLPWRADLHREYIDKYDHGVGSAYLPTYVLGNHDKPRIATRIGRESARLGAMLQLTLRGIPFIYYGEELGMKNTDIPKTKIQDTFEINSPGLGLGRDPARTPMQWNAKSYAGFSTAGAWLPVDKDYKIFNVEKELKDPKSCLNLYKKLITIRKKFKALTIGSYESLDISSDSLFVYTRTFGKDSFLIVLNYSSEEQIVDLGRQLNGQIICSTYMDKQEKISGLKSLPLRPYEGVLIHLK